jgi:hypothetical protein
MHVLAQLALLCSSQQHMSCILSLLSVCAALRVILQATPQDLGNLPLVNGYWPFRPVQSSPFVLQLPKPVTGLKCGDGVDQVRGLTEHAVWLFDT